VAVAGKRALWDSLRTRPELAELPGFDFEALMLRADEQLLALDTLRRDAAALALGA
jgi:hypothetical protein